MNCICHSESSYINNPSQRVFSFFPSVRPNAYEEGHETGLRWDAIWMPGGPWIFINNHRESHPRYAEFQRMEQEDTDRHEAWLEGFKAGLKKRLEDNSDFAKWWKDGQAKLHNEQRYYRDIEELIED